MAAELVQASAKRRREEMIFEMEWKHRYHNTKRIKCHKIQYLNIQISIKPD